MTAAGEAMIRMVTGPVNTWNKYSRKSPWAWILGTWIASDRNRTRQRDRRTVEVIIRRRIETVINKGNARVALLYTGDDVWHGWACATPGNVLWYVYVPPELSQKGIAREVITAAFGDYPESIACGWRPPMREDGDNRTSKRFWFNERVADQIRHEDAGQVCGDKDVA